MRVSLLAFLLAFPTFAEAQSLTIGGRNANYGSVRLRGGFTPDPHRVQVVSGGNLSAQRAVSGDCAGWVTSQPDVIVRVRNPRMFLRFFVEAAGDTTLVINDPNGRWVCNDDAVGTNPMVDFQHPTAGQYDVWIGSYSQGENVQASLAITELSHVRPGAQPTQPPRPPIVHQPQPQPQPYQPPLQPQPAQPPNPFAPMPSPPQRGFGYVFQGQVEQTPLSFSAPTIDGIYQQCVQMIGSARLGMIDDVTAFGRNAHNGPSYWDANAACAVVAINARPQGAARVQVSGTIEAVSYQIAGDPATVRRVVTTYVPMAMASDSTIDDVTINGQPYHNGPGYWTAAEVANMIASQVPWQ